MNSDIIILDNGSGYLKCGLSSKERPLVTMPSLIGRPMMRYDEKIDNFNIKVKNKTKKNKQKQLNIKNHQNKNPFRTL